MVVYTGGNYEVGQLTAWKKVSFTVHSKVTVT